MPSKWTSRLAFFLTSVLLLCQIVLNVNDHAVLPFCTMANTLFLVIIQYGSDPPNSLFYRTAACVSMMAILFVAITHCLEELSLPHIHDEEDEGEDHMHLSSYWISVCIGDLLLKCILVLGSLTPSLGIKRLIQLFLHVMPPFSVLMLHFAVPASVIGPHIPEYVIPVTGLVLSLVSIGITIPIFLHLKPYIFADQPAFFHPGKFSTEIDEMFEDVRCSHMHVYRLWPGRSFEALIHLDFLVNKEQSGWHRDAKLRYEEVCRYVRSALCKGGADKVVLEPRFIDHKEAGLPWMSCVAASCERNEKACCLPSDKV